jgi:hypothetical protein
MENQEAKQTEPVAAEAASQEAQGPDLNVTDLAALRSIIDVASQRGAFKAGELEAVGKIYNKLNSFLESVTKREQ